MAAFLNGGGELGRLIAAFPWETTALGPLAGWPPHVRQTVSLMLRSAVPMVALFREDGVMVYNDAYSVFAGGRHPRLLGSPVREGWPEVADFNDHVMRVGLAGGTLSYQDQELTLYRKGHAEQVWMNLDYSPVLDEDGVPAGVLAIVVETTGKVQAERRLAYERLQLSRMFEQAPSFMCTLAGPQHVFEFANEAYVRVFGREVVGRTARQAFPEIEGQGLFEMLDRVYATGEPWRADAIPLQVRRSPGAAPEQLHLTFVYQPLRDENGRVTGIFCEGYDVSETVRANRDLRRTQDWLQEGLEAAQMVAFEWEFGTRMVRYSPNSGKVLGYGDGDGEPDVGWSSLHPEDRTILEEAIGRAVSDLAAYKAVTRRIRPDTGGLMWTDTRGRVYPGPDGKPAVMRGIVIDVTERVRSEQALTEANRRKDEFLAMLAHELRNPLAPISNASALLARAPDRVDAVRNLGQVIERQVRHMSRLVDDLLDVSRVTRGQIQLERVPVDLKSVVHSALEQSRPFLESRQHAVSTQLPAEAVWVQGDRTRLVQVLSNLLHNAAKFTPPGGRVEVSLAVAGGRAELAVRDNGTGLDAQLLPHVFELFIQGERTPDRSQGGLGIGLALVRALVGLHGGEVRASSEGLERGSVFSVLLPLAPAPADAAPGDAAQAAPPRRLDVLVTDDNADAAQSLASLLELDGHTVHVCFDGAQALAWAAEHRPDVCILDVGLPDLTGLELCRRLRRMPHLQGAAFIALTGYGQAHDRAASAEAGFAHHLVKPVEPPVLFDVLAAVAARPAPR